MVPERPSNHGRNVLVWQANFVNLYAPSQIPDTAIAGNVCPTDFMCDESLSVHCKLLKGTKTLQFDDKVNANYPFATTIKLLMTVI